MLLLIFFFFNDTATAEIYTLSLHDALPILGCSPNQGVLVGVAQQARTGDGASFYDASFAALDRKSTRLNSSHSSISYAVFCLKKKNTRDTVVVPRRPNHPSDRRQHQLYPPP